MTNTHSEMVANAFNGSSFTYDEHAHMQFTAGQRLIQQVTMIRNTFPHVVDAGCGTGSTTESLARAIHFQSLYAVDIAEHTLSRAASLNKEIRFKNLDFNSINSLPLKFDLIFSNMALHWSRSFRDTIIRLRQSVTHSGMLAFTVPMHGTFFEIKEHFSILSFFKKQEIMEILSAAGFRLIDHSEQIYRESYPDAITALRSLKLTGVHHVGQRRVSSLRGKEFVKSLPFNSLSYVNGFFIAEPAS